MITLAQVSKSFGDIQAVREVSLSISAGEVVGLLGPNGAGKTTTMRLMSGHLFSDAGEVTINGLDMQRSLRECQSSIGYLPENNPLYTELTVAEFLSYSANLHQVAPTARKQALDWIVPAIGLTDMYHRPIKELSKGYRQRVGVAGALLHDPSVLILDEPTEGLDPNQRTELRTLLQTLAKNRTLIISTHVLQEVAAICDRIVILNQGKIVADGSPAELSANPPGTFTAVLSGKDIVATLKKATLLTVHSHQKAAKDKITVTLSPIAGKDEVPPLLMSLAKRYHWIIWSLTATDSNLERIFQAATTPYTV